MTNALTQLADLAPHITGPLHDVAQAAVALADPDHCAAVLALVERSAAGATVKGKAAIHARAVDAAKTMALVPATTAVISLRAKTGNYAIESVRERMHVATDQRHFLAPADWADKVVVIVGHRAPVIPPDLIGDAFVNMPSGKALQAACMAELIGAAK